MTPDCRRRALDAMTFLERTILQHVHDSWRKTLSGPQKRTCDVLQELSPSLPPIERARLPDTLASLVMRGWLIRHTDSFYEATELGEAELSKLST